jgi:hypothetical protein
MDTTAFTDNHFADFFTAPRRAGFAAAVVFLLALVSFRAIADRSAPEAVSATAAAGVLAFDAFTFGCPALDFPAGDRGAGAVTAAASLATKAVFAGFLREFGRTAFVGRVSGSAVAAGTTDGCGCG